MRYQGVIITGTSGAGKSTIARKLCEKHNTFQKVQSVTTRSSREDNHSGEYQYVNKEEFRRLHDENELLIEGKYRGEYYGTIYSALEHAVNNNKIPLLVLTTEYVNKYAEKSKGSLSHKENNKELIFFTVFLDAPDNILNERLTHRREKIDEIIKRQRKMDRKYAEICLYKVENLDVEKTVEFIWSLWKHRNISEIFPK